MFVSNQTYRVIFTFGGLGYTCCPQNVKWFRKANVGKQVGQEIESCWIPEMVTLDFDTSCTNCLQYDGVIKF